MVRRTNNYLSAPSDIPFLLIRDFYTDISPTGTTHGKQWEWTFSLSQIATRTSGSPVPK